MSSAASEDARAGGARAICAAFALAQLALHVAASWDGGFGRFRDELYYIACSERLSAGYVDLPPLSAWVLALQRALLGDSVLALRLVPALAGAAVVWSTGRLAQRLGAGRGGVALACLACTCSPIVLGFTGFYSMNALDLLFWAIASHLLLDVLARPRLPAWLALGGVCGLALLNKLSAAWLVGGIFVALCATPHRALLRTRGPWLAAAVALLLFAPYVAWNARHDFAHLEFMRNASAGKYSGLSAWTFLAGQLEIHHPLSAPIWLLGLWFLLVARAGKPFRALGWIWLSACAVLVAHGNSKPEYLCAAFPPLFAAGGAATDLARGRRAVRALRGAWAALLAVTTVPIVPLVLPILGVERTIELAARLGQEPGSSEGKELGPLPQFYADMFGWEEKVDAVARAFERLAPEERALCAIFASNYGRCAAVDFYGDARGLPDAIGSHNNYWIWGPRGYDGRVLLVLAADLGGREQLFAGTEVLAEVPHHPFAMPYENGLKVFACRGLRVPVAELWAELRHYD